MLLLTDISRIKGKIDLGKAISLISSLRENTENMIVISSETSEQKLPDEEIFSLNLNNSELKKEVLEKYTSHFTKSQRRLLTEKLKDKSLKEIINICENVDKYWNEHYDGVEKPSFKIYMQLVLRKM